MKWLGVVFLIAFLLAWKLPSSAVNTAATPVQVHKQGMNATSPAATSLAKTISPSEENTEPNYDRETREMEAVLEEWKRVKESEILAMGLTREQLQAVENLEGNSDELFSAKSKELYTSTDENRKKILDDLLKIHEQLENALAQVIGPDNFDYLEQVRVNFFNSAWRTPPTRE